MAEPLEARAARCAEAMRRQAREFADPKAKDGLPWAVVQPFDAQLRGILDRDRRIEEERDRVLIAAVKLAETPPADTDEVAAARDHLVDAIDFLEQAVIRFGRAR